MPTETRRATTTFGRLVEIKAWEKTCEKMRADSREQLCEAKDDASLLFAAHRVAAVEQLIETVKRHAANESAKPLPKFEAV